MKAKMGKKSSAANAKSGDEELHAAARSGDMQAVQRICAVNPLAVNARDRHSRTPLHLAAWSGHAEVVNYLCNNKAEVGAAAMDDMGAIHFAAQKGHLEVIKILVGFGVSIKSCNRKGMTPLHYATQGSNQELVKYLLRKGANKGVKNKAGKTAVDLASTEEICKLLVEYEPSSGKVAVNEGEKSVKAEREASPEGNLASSKVETAVEGEDEPESLMSNPEGNLASPKVETAVEGEDEPESLKRHGEEEIEGNKRESKKSRVALSHLLASDDMQEEEEDRVYVQCPPPIASSRRQNVLAHVQQVDAQPEVHVPIEASPPDKEQRNPSPDQSDSSDAKPESELLLSFESHVAYNIWRGTEREVMKVQNHTKKLLDWEINIVRENHRFRNLLSGTGFLPIRLMSYSHPNRNVILAFVERWHSETNSFHMPFGEMTITLDDVFCLTGLAVAGAPVVSRRSDRPNIIDEIKEMFGVDREAALHASSGARGSSVRIEWLKDKFQKNMVSQDATQLQACARAYLLYLLGCALFPDKSGNRVQTSWLEYLKDMDRIGEYAWGAAVLAYLYRQLGSASSFSTRQMCGFTTLLEAWIYEHFPSIVRPPFNPSFKTGSPLAMRWQPDVQSVPTIERIQGYRERLDRLTMDQVIWDPYVGMREDYPRHEVTFFRGCIAAGEVIEPYMPDRVLRQFGHVQTIPRIPIANKNKRRVNASTKSRDVWKAFAECFIDWDGHLLSARQKGELVVSLGDTFYNYMEWYERVGHPRVQNPSDAIDTPSHAYLVDPYQRIIIARGLVAPFLQRHDGGEFIPGDDWIDMARSVYKVLTDDAHASSSQVVDPQSEDVPSTSSP